jgi:drug/metabolite transporter (DMT)-like permease
MAASRVTMFVAFTPLTALALGTLLLGEPIPWRLAPALLLVLAGLWVARDRAG